MELPNLLPHKCIDLRAVLGAYEQMLTPAQAALVVTVADEAHPGVGEVHRAEEVGIEEEVESLEFEAVPKW